MEVLPGIHHIRTAYDDRTVYVTAIVPPRDHSAGITLIDTGTADVPHPQLSSYLHGIGRDLTQVRRILNTHGHPDHAGGNGVLTRWTDAAVHVHGADHRFVEDPVYQWNQVFGRWLTAASPKKSVPGALTAADFARQMSPGLSVDVALGDGDDVDCGLVRLRVVHTPGHTAGSVSFYWPERGLLITGDAIQGASSSPTGFPLIASLADYRRSLALIESLDVDLLVTAHDFRGLVGGGVATRSGEEATSLLRDSAVVIDGLELALEGSRQESPGELVESVLERMRSMLGIPPGTTPPPAIATILAAASDKHRLPTISG
jgi:glyoxylase-like metal-dependent hydrolase (beta-lactamase superfamily II)